MQASPPRPHVPQGQPSPSSIDPRFDGEQRNSASLPPDFHIAAPPRISSLNQRPNSQYSAASGGYPAEPGSRPISQYADGGRGSPRPDFGAQPPLQYGYPDSQSQLYPADPRQPQNYQEFPDPPSPPDGDGFYTSSGYPQQPPVHHPYAPSVAPSGPPRSTNSPPPILDHSHLRPGKQAALLSHETTLNLYRANAKKTQDPELIFEFAVFMIEASKSIHVTPDANGSNQLEVERSLEKRDEVIKEALALLKKIADRGHVSAQYFLADCYANGIGTVRNRQDFDRAFPLFVLAAKHGHTDAAYRAGTCCENGWGTRREAAKAVQFYRKAAAQSHPGAMYRLGVSELNGELGLSKSPKEGVKWLKRSAEHATAEFPHALHELALLHATGLHNVVFVDLEYATELLAQAAELGYAPSAYKLGECYEYAKMGCPQDPALSIHYYNIAAQQNHRDACFALTAWYLVGSPGVLPQSDTEAFLWGKRAADAGLVKAMYAVGYFFEIGIGTAKSITDATSYYKRAAENGDKRAQQRLKTIGQNVGGSAPLPPLPGESANFVRRDREVSGSGEGKGGKDCIIM